MLLPARPRNQPLLLEGSTGQHLPSPTSPQIFCLSLSTSSSTGCKARPGRGRVGSSPLARHGLSGSRSSSPSLYPPQIPSFLSSGTAPPHTCVWLVVILIRKEFLSDLQAALLASLLLSPSAPGLIWEAPGKSVWTSALGEAEGIHLLTPLPKK